MDILKKYFYLAIFVPLLFAACKKDKTVYTSMTLFVNGDSTWTTTDVSVSTQSDGSVLVYGKYSPTYETISLTLADYRDGRKTYYIGSGTVPGYAYGSSAVYNYSTSILNANGGNIAVTDLTAHTMNGTFDFYDSKLHVTGYFKSPKP